MDKTCYVNVFDDEDKARVYQSKMIKQKFDVSFLGPVPAVELADDSTGQTVYSSPPGSSYFVVRAYNQGR